MMASRVQAVVGAVLLAAGLAAFSRQAGALAPIDTETVPELADRELVESVLKLPNQVPPLLADDRTKPLRFEELPRYPRNVLLAHSGSGRGTEIRELVQNAVQVLIDTNKAFVDTMPLLPENDERRRAVVAEVQQRQVELAEVYARLESCHADLKAAAELRARETPLWKANTDYVTVRLLFRMVHFYEYQVALSKVRKEDLPKADRKVHKGYKLVSHSEVSDGEAKELAREARKTLKRLAKENRGTPWDVIARRAQVAQLGLEWEPY